jgi:hypothetical protein
MAASDLVRGAGDVVLPRSREAADAVEVAPEEPFELSRRD